VIHMTPDQLTTLVQKLRSSNVAPPKQPKTPRATAKESASDKRVREFFEKYSGVRDAI
jgi:hypothetical protein